MKGSGANMRVNDAPFAALPAQGTSFFQSFSIRVFLYFYIFWRRIIKKKKYII